MGNKLELSWLNKEKDLQIEPRILIENAKLSYSSKNQTLFDIKDNMLIHGDNLLALKSLEAMFSQSIKCIYIDPPYNTGAAFDLYDDNVEHSTWLTLMKERLKIMQTMLSKQGVIYVQIDANEMHYLKVLMDEVFGRANYLATITCKVKAPSGVASGSQIFFDCSEYILCYAKNKPDLTYEDLNEDAEIVDENSKTAEFYKFLLKNVDYSKKELLTEIDGEKVYRLPPEAYQIEQMTDFSKESYYKNLDIVFRTAALSGGREKIIKSYIDSIENNDGVFIYEHIPSKGKRAGKVCEDLIYKKGGILMLKDFAYKNEKKKCVIKQQHITSIFYNDWWQGIANEGGVTLKNGKKPEILIKTLLDIATKPGDIVLDSFLGSGTTIAVAHKMGRKWIGIEMGEQAYTHCKFRLDNIIDGNDKTGVTKICSWKSGGGYKFYEIAPTLINVDTFGQPIINSNYNPDMLAAAVALHEGFNYNPDTNCYWKQSKINNTYLFVSTNHITVEIVNSIKGELKDDEYLVIACKSFDLQTTNISKNITIKKIPQSLLKNCAFGINDYKLNIIELPELEEEE